MPSLRVVRSGRDRTELIKRKILFVLQSRLAAVDRTAVEQFAQTEGVSAQEVAAAITELLNEGVIESID